MDLLKIDVEGFEPNVLRGAEGYLNRGKIRAILCEFNDYWLTMNGSSSQHLLEQIRDYGFQAEVREPDLNRLQSIFFNLYGKGL